LAETPPNPPRNSRFFDLERDRSKQELYRPDSLLRTTEWGLLTVGSLLAALAFPPYFIQVLLLAFFNAGGLFWVTHLSEKGRQRLRQFEAEFSEGHKQEEAGLYKEAAELYARLYPLYQDFPRIAEIAARRIEFLKKTQPQAFSVKATKAAKPARPAKKKKKKP
jgi:hypothetical protein